MALSGRKKKPLVLAESRSTTPGSGARVPQRPLRQLAFKLKINDLAISGDTSEHTNRHPVISEWSAHLPARESAVTGEQAFACSRQIGPPEGDALHVALLAGPVATFQPSESFKPTAMYTFLPDTLSHLRSQ
jgi:hypothetical protein